MMRIYVKGASEIILEKCTNIKTDKALVPITPSKAEGIKRDIIIKYADRALRTLAIAYKDVNYDPNYETIADTVLESNLNLICIAGIKDPLRKEIPSAIAKCKSAGITVRMVTGDNVTQFIQIYSIIYIDSFRSTLQLLLQKMLKS